MPKTNIKFTTIHNWMITDLGLKGNELLIYAVIYGYSNIDGQWYTANQQSIADFCGIERKNLYRILNKLYDKGLIVTEKVEQVGCAKTYKYKAIEPQNEACNEPQNEACNEPHFEACNEPHFEACNEPQNEAQYINNNKNINNNYYPDTSQQLNGQIEFDTTDTFDSYCSSTLNITIKKKIMDMTNLSDIAVKQIVDTANKVNMSDSKLIEVIKYCMTKECKDLAGYIIKTIPNYVEPKQNSSKSGFNNFNGRSYTEKDYEAIEKALLSH